MSSVSIVKCQDYDESRVDEAVRKAVNHLGGIKFFVKKGDKVLLKVNLLQESTPDQSIVTHPAVVSAVARLVKEAGGKAIIADSPGGAYTESRLKATYEKAGLIEVARETGAELNYNTEYSPVSNPRGKIIKRFDVIKVAQEADVIITLPKFKTHLLTRFTGATKILFGVIPGREKMGFHSKHPKVEDFSDMLIDLLCLLKPNLAIMDGVIGMEGDGPATGGKPKNIGVILASQDSVALDLCATDIVGWKPHEVPPIEAAMRRGLTNGKVEDVKVLGEKLQDVRLKGFLGPGTQTAGIAGKLPPIVRSMVTNFFIAYPAPNMDCIGCGVCAENCPEKAIRITSGKAKVTYGKCIRCYCCHELCPHNAIDLKKSIALRLLNGR
ncbi:MAG: DUF362 domain-containing protein [Candidatus Altiarchaeota archaeon]